ncbi:outer membrane beta-barrel protein [Ascidiimonas sp. W6]|uniref:outer membrane beta-barrel protein n=1 Tax=Ascidiimonas meishanensis TaxID=3128903 RepID=UPI0030EF2B0E
MKFKSILLKEINVLSIVFFLLGSSLYSQHIIKGNVENLKNEPLPFSTIHILNTDKKTILKSAFSNGVGEFKITLDTISLDKTKYMYARYLGEKSDTIAIVKNKPITFIIKNSGAINLSEVVVNAERPTLIAKSDRFIYTPNKTLKEGLSALELLKIAPLIDFNARNDELSIINKENTMVIINGRKSTLPREMLASLLKTTPARNIKDIEIITNPGSEYTANTTGGIININLKRNLDEGFLGNLSLVSEQANVFNTSILNASLNYRKGKVGIRISPFINRSFNYNETDIQVVNANNRRENTTGEFERKYFVLGGGFGLDYNIDSQNLLSINGFISQVDGNSNQTNITNYTPFNESVIDSTFSSPIDSEDYYLYNFGNIFYEHKLDTIDKRKITLNVDYNQFRKENTDSGSFNRIFPNDVNSTDNQYRNVFPQDFFNISGSVDYSSKINDKSKISMGTQVSTTNFENDLSYFTITDSGLEENSDLSNTFQFKENYLAGYVSYSKTFSKKLNATFGLRIEGTNYLSENETTQEKIDSSYVNLFPNLSLAYTIKDKKILSMALSKKIRRPSIESLLPGRTFINPNFFVENNPFLQPFLFYNGEVMYAINYKYFISGGFSYIDNQSDDFIIPIIENGETLQKRTTINYGNSTKTYLTFFTRQKWFKGLWRMDFSGSLNFLSFRDQTNNLLDSKINNVNYNITMNNTLFLSDKKGLMAFVILRYYSPIENVAFERENALFKTDLGLKKTFKNLSLNLYLSDIFNTYNETRIKYRSNLVQLFNRQIRNEFTRSISLSVNYSFGNSRLKRIERKKIANDELKNRL